MKRMRGKDLPEMRHLHQVCMVEHPWAVAWEHPQHSACPYINPQLPHARCGVPNTYTCEVCDA